MTAAQAPDDKSRREPRGELGSVLVIGGCGFLGHHVVRVVLRDWAVRSVAVADLRCARNRQPESAVPAVTYHEVDITDRDQLGALVAALRPDVVVHTASPAPHAQSRIGHDMFRRVNVDGTACVIDACRAAGVKALVYTSSASVVSDNVSDLVNADESWPVIRGDAQTEYYTETKAAAEELVIAANGTRDAGAGAMAPPLLTCAIRPATIMGEGDGMLFYHLHAAYREGRTRFQIGDNNNLFDFTYVENVAHAHLLAAHALLVTSARVSSLSSPSSLSSDGGDRSGGPLSPSIPPLDHERVDGEVFFVTNDQPVYFWDFTRAVWHAFGSQLGAGEAWVIPRGVGLVLGLAIEWAARLTGIAPTFSRQRFLFSSMTRYYNVSKAKSRLGYRPLVSLQEGLERAVGWFLEQDAKEEKKESSQN